MSVNEKSCRVFERSTEGDQLEAGSNPAYLSPLPPSTHKRYAASLCQVLGENHSAAISLSSSSLLHCKFKLIFIHRSERQTPGANRLRPDLHPQTVASISTGRVSFARLENRRSRLLVLSGRMMLPPPLQILAEVARRGR